MKSPLKNALRKHMKKSIHIKIYCKQTSKAKRMVCIYLRTPTNNTNLLDSLECIRQQMEQISPSFHNILQSNTNLNKQQLRKIKAFLWIKWAKA